MKITVIGDSIFVGTRLVKYLLGSGNTTINCRHVSAEWKQPLEYAYKVIELITICEYVKLFSNITLFWYL